MTGCVDDVDAEVVPANCGVFRQDGYATLFFNRVGIHQAFGLFLAHVERAGLLKQLVDKRGFAMVNMGYDGDVAEILDHGRVLSTQRPAPKFPGDRRVR